MGLPHCHEYHGSPTGFPFLTQVSHAPLHHDESPGGQNEAHEPARSAASNFFIPAESASATADRIIKIFRMSTPFSVSRRESVRQPYSLGRLLRGSPTSRYWLRVRSRFYRRASFRLNGMAILGNPRIYGRVILVLESSNWVKQAAATAADAENGASSVRTCVGTKEIPGLPGLLWSSTVSWRPCQSTA